MDLGAEVSRRTMLKGSAATAAALALPINRLLGYSAVAKGTEGGTVTLGVDDDAAGVAGVAKALIPFTKKTGIKVNVFSEAGASDTWVSVFQTISTRLAAGEPLDTAIIATEGMLLFENKGVLEPLDSYIAADKAVVQNFYNDINPQLLARYRALDAPHGHTYFMPLGYNVMGIWFNRELFKQLNIAEPAPDWTWDDFESIAAKIADPPNRYGYSIYTPPSPFTDVYPWVLTAGGEIMNPAQTKCVANNPGAIQAAEFVVGLIKKQLVNAPGGSYNPFTEAPGGKLGMLGAGIWPNISFGLPQKTINSQFAIVPWPQMPKPATPVGLGGLGIFKSSKNKAATWELIKYTMSEEFQADYQVAVAGGMPMRQSIARSKEFLSQYPPGTENFSNELTYSTMIVGVPNGSAVENEIGVAWEQILTGATSPAAGLEAMETTCNQLMAQQV